MNVIDLGAEDIQEKDSEIEIYCEPSALKAVREGLQKLGVPVERAEVSLVPKNTVHLEGAKQRKFSNSWKRSTSKRTFRRPTRTLIFQTRF